MTRRTGRSPGGFTLVEMLVVIAVIGVLAAILTPTLYLAFAKAKVTKIATDLNQISMSIEEYKLNNGDYPPDWTNTALVQRHLRTAFPRNQEPLPLDTTKMLRPDGTPPLDSAGNPAVIANLDPSEALVFWLGMVKDDTRLPLTGSGDLIRVYELDLERLVDPDDDGWYSYAPPDGEGTPYVYFDSRTYRIAAYPKNLAAANQPWNPTPQVVPYIVNPTAAATVRYANPTKYQIISAGLDGDFGAVTLDTNGVPVPKLFLDPTTLTLEDLDNISNFSAGKVFEDFVE